MELTTLEKYFCDRIGCEVSTHTGRIGINLGLNFITELSGHRKVSKPKVNGIRIFILDEKKVLVFDLEMIKISSDLIVRGWENILREFIIYFFLIDEVGVLMSKSFGNNVGVEVSNVDDILKRYKDIGWNKNKSSYLVNV